MGNARADDSQEPGGVELVWPGKRTEVDRIALPFQTIETVNEGRAAREDLRLFRQRGEPIPDWRNKLIWGDNLYVVGSLLEDFAGKVDLIYIDPPFATGADFSFTVEVGEEEVTKEPSLIEEKAYRDTWGAGLASYLDMMRDRLTLLRELLAPSGSIFIHMDWHVGHEMKLLMDEVFGEGNSLGEIIWAYGSPSGGRVSGSKLVKAHDIILSYAREYGQHKYAVVYLPYSEKYVRDWFRYEDEDGRQYQKRWRRDSEGNSYAERQYLDESPGVPASTVWSDIQQVYADPRAYKKGMTSEITGFPTQKPIALLERIIEMSSDPGDIVADFFCGSGTTMAAAERLGRRWIGCDLSRWAVHLVRKRLLDMQIEQEDGTVRGAAPFEVLNLGKYERHYWQTNVVNGGETGQQALWEYIAFIVKLYDGQTVSGFTHLHGRKGSRMVHVGATDAPVTMFEIEAALGECQDAGQKALDVLGWEWEMGLYDLMPKLAEARDIDLRMLQIPREVMDERAVERGDVHFYELAYLDALIEQDGRSKRRFRVALHRFVIPNPELIPPEVRDKIAKWSDYIDYWAVDWDYREDTFHNQWQDYRTRGDRSLQTQTDWHPYEEPGTYQVMVKVIDIFGNDTTTILEAEVE